MVVEHEVVGQDLVVPLPAPAVEQVAPAPELQMLIEMDAEGKIRIDEKELDLEGLEALLLEKQKEHPGLFVALKADPKMDAQKVIAVVQLTQKLKIAKLVIVE